MVLRLRGSPHFCLLHGRGSPCLYVYFLDHADLHRRKLEMRLLADRVPRREGKLVGSAVMVTTRVSAMPVAVVDVALTIAPIPAEALRPIPVAVMERHEDVALLD